MWHTTTSSQHHLRVITVQYKVIGQKTEWGLNMTMVCIVIWVKQDSLMPDVSRQVDELPTTHIHKEVFKRISYDHQDKLSAQCGCDVQLADQDRAASTPRYSCHTSKSFEETIFNLLSIMSHGLVQMRAT